MTKLSELQLRQSEIRERINALLNKESRTEEETAELREATDSAQKLELELRAAIVLEDEADKNAREASTDPEALELRQLADRSNLGSILGAAVEKRSTDGAEAELQQHHGLAANQFPLELLRLRPEERALTPAPTNVEVLSRMPSCNPYFAAIRRAPTLASINPRSLWGGRGFSGLDFAAGRPGTVHRRRRRGRDNGRFRFRALGSLADPQASFLWKRTDAARFTAMDSALRMALSEGLAEKADQEIVNGDGAVC